MCVISIAQLHISFVVVGGGGGAGGVVVVVVVVAISATLLKIDLTNNPLTWSSSMKLGLVEV